MQKNKHSTQNRATGNSYLKLGSLDTLISYKSIPSQISVNIAPTNKFFLITSMALTNDMNLPVAGTISSSDN